MLKRLADQGDVAAGFDDTAGSLGALLALAEQFRPGEKAPVAPDGSVSSMPLVEIAGAKTEEEAIAGLDVWRSRHLEAVASLEPADVLVDGIRGASARWNRIRINCSVHLRQSTRATGSRLRPVGRPRLKRSGRA